MSLCISMVTQGPMYALIVQDGPRETHVREAEGIPSIVGDGADGERIVCKLKQEGDG